MKAKHAIGITVNGNEVRAAFLSLVRGKARIKALESTTLDTPLEQLDSTNKSSLEPVNDLENAFDINEPLLNQDEAAGAASDGNPNIGKVYTLLDKFQNLRASIAINAPHLTVKYDFVNKVNAPSKKERLRAKIDIWGGDAGDGRHQKYISAHGDKILLVDYEYNPPVLDLMEEVNQFRANNLSLVLMDTNELALVDLVKEIYKFEKDEITAIVYVEQDFSRVIFLKGSDLYHITPTLHKGSLSDDVLDVLYSRIIFAQDHYFIPEIGKILVAGHSSRLKAKYYFRQKFPAAIVGYLNSKKIQSDLRFKDRGLLFSRYAVPIALAWKALLKNVVKSTETNFLPEHILDRQKLPKLALHGYALLAIIVVTVSLFTWALVTKKLEVSQVTRRMETLKQQIDNNKALTDRVHDFDGQIREMDRKIALVDSFGTGFEESTMFLQVLNQGIRQTGNIWIQSINKKEETVAITGMAIQRDKIPVLASSIGGANLKKVTRSTYEGNDVFTFQLEKQMDAANMKNQATFMFNDRPPISRNTSALNQTETAANLARNEKNDRSATQANGRQLSGGSAVASDYAYGLRIGVYQTPRQAAKAGKYFKEKGYELKLSPLETKGKTQYALTVGSFSKIEEAQKLQDALGANGQVVRFKKSG